MMGTNNVSDKHWLI